MVGRSDFFCVYRVAIFYSIVLIFRVSGTCELLTYGGDYETTFLFEEVAESHEVGVKLPGSFFFETGEFGAFNLDLSLSPIHTRSLEQAQAEEYINASLNYDTSTIDFYLQKSLQQFHLAHWKPNLEYGFTLSCSNKTTATYTYMIAIKDENLHRPTFTSNAYSGKICFSLTKGFTFAFDENESAEGGIQVTDADFNLKNGNISISCEGPHCTFFKFIPTYKGFDKGQKFNIEIQLNPSAAKQFIDEVNDGDTFNFTITASDSSHSSNSADSADVSLRVSIRDGNLGNNKSSFPTGLTIGAVSAVVLVLISCTASVAYLVMKRRKAKDILRQLTAAEIREFLEGSVSFSSEGTGRISLEANLPIIALPYNRSFEIPRDKMKIDETTILGTGAFGIVWKGCITEKNGNRTTVAVKSVKRNVGVLYFKALLSELKIMAYIGRHQNIVSLVGACTHNIQKSMEGYRFYKTCYKTAGNNNRSVS